jgi:hypothetical protein
MGTTPVCTIDAQGIHSPTFATILAWAVSQFQSIYGTDIVLDSSTQDGEMVGLLATAIADTNAMCVQAYNSFSPSTAQGTGLSSVVKINGMARKVPSYSHAPMLIVGNAGTTVSSGRIADAAGFVWALPATVVIPGIGQVASTGICETLGAISAPVGTINQIVNTQPGWQTASNVAVAAVGAPVETDAQLRIRQSLSTMDSSTALTTGLEGAVLALPGVNRARVFANTDNLPDANGIPGHCVSVVVDSGDVNQIAAVILAKKGGCGTYGTTFVTLTDAYGVKSKIALFPAGQPLITVKITLNQLSAFTTDVIGLIQNSVSDYINALGIGNGIQWNRLYAPAYLFGAPQAQTFEIVTLGVARDGATPTSADVAMLFKEAPLCRPEYVTVTVLN